MNTKKILAFATSNSSKSINHQLVESVAKQVEGDVEIVRLTDYDIPMYGIDEETSNGFPKGVEALLGSIQSADGLIISIAEHNGNVTAFFKSVFDWLSRKERNFLGGNKILLMSTSPGKGGGASAHGLMTKSMPFFGGEVVATFILPEFYNSFKEGEVIDSAAKETLEKSISTFEGAL